MPSSSSFSQPHSTVSDELYFYEDEDTPGNAVAVGPIVDDRDGRAEGFRATYNRENSPVSWGVVPPSAIGGRLTEEQARAKHPRMFEKIDRIEAA